MNALSKLQNLPEKTKKIILWVVVIIIGLCLFTWWAKNLPKRIEMLHLQNLNMPKIEELKDTPEIEEIKELIDLRKKLLQDRNEKQFKNLEEIIKQLKEQKE